MFYNNIDIILDKFFSLFILYEDLKYDIKKLI